MSYYLSFSFLLRVWMGAPFRLGSAQRGGLDYRLPPSEAAARLRTNRISAILCVCVHYIVGG